MSFPLFTVVQRNHLICCPPFAGFLLSSIPRAAFGATEPPLKPCRAKEAEKERDPGRHTPRPAPLSTPLFRVSVLRLFPSTRCVWTWFYSSPGRSAPEVRTHACQRPQPLHRAWRSGFLCGVCKGRARERKGPRDRYKEGREARKGREEGEEEW